MNIKTVWLSSEKALKGKESLYLYLCYYSLCSCKQKPFFSPTTFAKWPCNFKPTKENNPHLASFITQHQHDLTCEVQNTGFCLKNRCIQIFFEWSLKLSKSHYKMNKKIFFGTHFVAKIYISLGVYHCEVILTQYLQGEPTHWTKEGKKNVRHKSFQVIKLSQNNCQKS